MYNCIKNIESVYICILNKYYKIYKILKLYQTDTLARPKPVCKAQTFCLLILIFNLGTYIKQYKSLF